MKKILILITIFLSQSGFSLAEDIEPSAEDIVISIQIPSNEIPIYLRCSDNKVILGIFRIPVFPIDNCYTSYAGAPDRYPEKVVIDSLALNTDLFEIDTDFIDQRYIHNVKLKEIQSIGEELNCAKLLLKEDGFDCFGGDIQYEIKYVKKQPWPLCSNYTGNIRCGEAREERQKITYQTTIDIKSYENGFIKRLDKNGMDL
ncbi:MAG: hypothetical protein OXC37_02825 [Bdellovibrionaceae bacterium]|nr:hypothetical protein [Pseudobdellovibrionaceae bacterium]